MPRTLARPWPSCSRPPDVWEADRLLAWAPREWPVADDWRPVVERFLDGPAGHRLADFVRARLATGAIIYPPTPFQALLLTPLSRVRVVILGQDPYHGPGQAHGLAFSVADGVRPPPSLRNIFAEVDASAASGTLRGSRMAHRNGNLTRWADQGVLLLNTCLTVEQGLPGSHAGHGWEHLADDLLQAVLQRPGPAVFMLWGSHAQAYRLRIEGVQHPDRHLVLCSNHPSPLSARRPPVPFIGCGHFRAANAFLARHASVPVDWSV